MAFPWAHTNTRGTLHPVQINGKETMNMTCTHAQRELNRAKQARLKLKRLKKKKINSRREEEQEGGREK